MGTSDDGSPGYTLDHVAFGVRRVADAVPFLVGTLGGEPLEGGPGIGFQGGQWRFAGGGVLEVIEPAWQAGSAGGFLERFLTRRGPGIHHVTFKVPGLRDAAERARRFGYEIVGYSEAFAGWKECFLHPRQAHGIVVQLAQSDPSVDAGQWGQGWSFPPAPPRPPTPARVVGLRLVAHDVDTARRQWGALLGGAETREGDALVFRWPESGLRIALDIDATAEEEGPRCIEVKAAHAIALPDGPVPALGARFVRI